jgi:hypothetical protein
MANFRQFSDRQLVQLIQRRSPDHEERISKGLMEAFLNGELVTKDGRDPDSVVVNMTLQIDAMIRAGYHRVTNSKDGMSVADYRALWPSVVEIPEEHVGKFDMVLLVDGTITPHALANAAELEDVGVLELCVDLVDCPRDIFNERLGRYVAFVKFGCFDKSAQHFRDNKIEEEVGLVTIEGLHLLVQFKAQLAKKGTVFLPGSRCGESGVPTVARQSDGTSRFSSKHRDQFHFRLGSAYRGVRVIEV